MHIILALMKAGSQVFQTIDVERVDAIDPRSSIKTFILDRKPKVIECDVFIAGGGMGGLAAAIRVAQKGLSVCVTEETHWIGGQMTAQGVSAFDENKYVEDSGATNLYQRLRERIRSHYERKNPGECWVSWCSFEPKVGLQKLEEIIAEETGKNQPCIFTRIKVVKMKVVRGRAVAALAVNLDTGKFTEYRFRFCIDATELGDLLPMLNIPYSSGAESRIETGEPHAPERPNPDNVQDFTYPFILEIDRSRNNTIPKPKTYDTFNSKGKFSLLGYGMFSDPPRNLPFWTYRRLISAEHLPQYQSDISMINWEAHDMRGENIIDCGNVLQAERLALGKLVSLGFLHWLQTEAPRDEGSKGYPEFKQNFDVLGTTDGLSMYPYIRESRRIKAKKIVVEQEIAAATNDGARAKLFPDSVGIGFYPIDIHGHQDVPGTGQASKPFQIPLGAMVQTTIRNFLPACKNIGTTHVTNGAYRLHPIEWAIGEAAGVVAYICIAKRARPETVRANKKKLREVQKTLVEYGSPVFWFDDIRTDDPDFAAIQMASITNLITPSQGDLHFAPDTEPNPADITTAARKLGISHPAEFTTRREFARWVYTELKKQNRKGVHL